MMHEGRLSLALYTSTDTTAMQQRQPNAAEATICTWAHCGRQGHALDVLDTRTIIVIVDVAVPGMVLAKVKGGRTYEGQLRWGWPKRGDRTCNG